MAAIFINMKMKVYVALTAFLLLGILPFFGSSLPSPESGMVTRDSSSITFIGLNTGNLTLDDLLASVPGGSNFNESGNATAVNNVTYCQSLSRETNVTMIEAVHFPPADEEVYSPDTRQEEGDSPSGVRMQLILVLPLTALLFLISQVPSGKRSRMLGIHP